MWWCYEVTVCISLMGKISGCHCISQAIPQNIQQHTHVIAIITYDNLTGTGRGTGREEREEREERGRRGVR